MEVLTVYAYLIRRSTEMDFTGAGSAERPGMNAGNTGILIDAFFYSSDAQKKYLQAIFSTACPAYFGGFCLEITEGRSTWSLDLGASVMCMPSGVRFAILLDERGLAGRGFL
ncbi:uncharacterized protein Dvir_GJ26674 [Drosophila virilis]|uniref:Uncharacterized protein n=1 Tax=Drosophila virilis TaxID=7244 RepID=A0A0Q9WFF4_DROVI|nr:uncharacterized protein Dvir_GJ26674 [Drosophila virilis]